RTRAATAPRLDDAYASALATDALYPTHFHGRSYYDALLDTSAILGALPERAAEISHHENDGLPQFIDRLFAAARGTAELPASAMTKWFDTNYHYIVPELSADQEFRLEDGAWLDDIRDQVNRHGDKVRPVLVAP